MFKPPKKPTACRPCHERKVRCDASISGTPCTRCVQRNEQDLCRPAKQKRTRIVAHNPPRRVPNQLNHRDAPLEERATSTAWSGVSVESGDRDTRPQHEQHELPIALQPAPINSFSVAEEDAQVQMYTCLTGDQLNLTPARNLDSTSPGCEVIQYQNELDHLSILCEASPKTRKPRLIRITIRDENALLTPAEHEADSAKRLSLNNVPDSRLKSYDKAEWDYVVAKGALELPNPQTRKKILRVYFDIVYPYAPVLDKADFAQGYLAQDPPIMLLHAIIANTLPFVSMDIIRSLGFLNRTAAIKSYNSKAILLYNLSSERPHSRLELLQVSMLLGTLQTSLTVDKDFRFWHHNAVRLATIMGLHEKYASCDPPTLRMSKQLIAIRDVSSALHPNELKLWRRIWWILFIRDVQMALAGLLSFPLLGSANSQITDLMDEDWPDENDGSQNPDWMPLTTQVQKLYQIEMCKLARIGATIWRALQQMSVESSPAIQQLFDAARQVQTHRNACPRELVSMQASSEWHLDYLWACIFQGYSYRAECIIYWGLSKRSDFIDPEQARILQKRHQGAMYELDTMFGRILMWDTIRLFPLGFALIVAMVLASHIQYTVKTSPRNSSTMLSRLYIPQSLEVLRKTQEAWDCIIWRVRLFERILEHYTNAGIDTGYAMPAQSIIPHDGVEDVALSFGVADGNPVMGVGDNGASTENMHDFRLDELDLDFSAWLGATVGGDCTGFDGDLTNAGFSWT